MQLISKKRFESWKEERQIPDNVLFGTSKSYFGLCFRSRPGAFFITDRAIVHWSYDPRYCSMAIFEKEIKVEVPLQEIREVRVEKLSFFWRLVFLGAKWVVRIKTSGEVKSIILYEEPKSFLAPVQRLGVKCVNL